MLLSLHLFLSRPTTSSFNRPRVESASYFGRNNSIQRTSSKEEGGGTVTISVNGAMPSGKLDIIVTSTPLDLFPRVAPFKQNKHIYPPPRARISEFTPLYLYLSLSVRHPTLDDSNRANNVTRAPPPPPTRTNRFRATDRLFPFLHSFPSNQPTADTLTGPWIDIEPNNPPRIPLPSSFYSFRYSKERKETLVTSIIELSRWEGKEGEGKVLVRLGGSLKGVGRKIRGL